MKHVVHTDSAPACLGTYSQAIKVGNTVYLAGQIPVDPVTNELVSNEVEAQAIAVFENLQAVALAAGGSLDSIVRIGVYLIELSDFPVINDVMKKYFKVPYPARTTIGVSALPKGSSVEVDAIMII
jgi:reactive intermediate/imine deaminase